MSGLKEILEKQRAFFKAGYSLDVRGRRAALSILASSIKEYEAEILAALKQDLGKSETEAYMTELGMALSEIKNTVRHLRCWASKRRVRTPLSQFPARSYILSEPYGNVLIMSPWNYPFLLSVSPLVSALAAGNTAVIKPSAYAPATSAVIRKVIENTFTEDYVAVVEGGREVNSDLLDQKFDYIFFTGSKQVGRIVMEKAARNLTPVTLELGGKSPVIVDEDVDIDVAAARIVFGKYLNLGQTCVAPDHVFVHEAVADRFLDACKSQIVKMFGDNPLESSDYGRVISAKHFERLKRTLQEISHVASAGVVDVPGGTVVAGGNMQEDTLRIAPTIVRLGALERVGEDAWNIDAYTIMQEEIFGPVLPLITYSSVTDVVDYVDEHPRPLAAYIFTRSRLLKSQLLSHLHFGGGCVNDTIIHLATEYMPFGGLGESGMGSYHGRWGFRTFSHEKSIVDKPFWLDIKMRYQPYGDKLKWIKRFL